MLFFIGLAIYAVVVVLTFVGFTKHEQRTDGFHNDDLVIMFHLLLSLLWFLSLPAFALMFVLKKFVKLITNDN